MPLSQASLLEICVQTDTAQTASHGRISVHVARAMSTGLGSFINESRAKGYQWCPRSNAKSSAMFNSSCLALFGFCVTEEHHGILQMKLVDYDLGERWGEKEEVGEGMRGRR